MKSFSMQRWAVLISWADTLFGIESYFDSLNDAIFWSMATGSGGSGVA
jgi:hypothetical protein